MKRHPHRRLYVCITFALIVMVLWGELQHRRAEMLFNERYDDMRMLFRANKKTRTATNIDNLIAILAANGEKLNNPIRNDAATPCYRLLIGTNNYALYDPNAILIGETNTTDNKLMFVLFCDGSIAALPKKLNSTR